MGRNVKKSKATLASVVVMSASLAACGGDSGAGGDTAETVKVGLIEPLSGPFADNGRQARLGAELCTQKINDDGGIESLDGAQIELIVKDTGAAAPAQVANQLQSMVTENDLSAIVGAWASSYTLAASTVAEQAKIPMVTESFADDITARGYQYIFKLPAHAQLMGQQGVDQLLLLAEQSGYAIDTAAIISDNTSSGAVSAEAASKQFKSQGVDVPVLELFSPGLTEGGSLALKVMAADPDVIYLNGALGDAALLQAAIREQGYTGPFLGAGSGFVATDYAETLGKSAEGTFSSAGWNWELDSDVASTFFDDFTAANPDFDFPGQEAGEDCAAMYIIAAGLEAAGSTDPEEVRDAISDLEITEGPATLLASGSVSFDDNGLLTGAIPVLIQWQDGLPRTVGPAEIAVSEPTFEFSDQ